ncbi:hypothetical protein KAR91_09935 [Candidatus Pacearchaeota archaeon]|nr:hypothetical protein [Candidatus Pacearchaeota archaeon]
MPLENFNSYTLTQTDGRLAVPSANRVNFTAYDRGHDGILYKQGFSFGDFEQLVDVHITGSSNDGWFYPFQPWALANDIGTRKELNDAAKLHLTLIYATNITNNFLSLHEFNGLGQIDRYTFGAGFDSHYITVKRTGTDATVEIYSDAERTSLLDTLSGTVSADAYSTVYGFQALGDVIQAQTITGNIQNLDLQIAVNGFPFFFDAGHF